MKDPVDKINTEIIDQKNIFAISKIDETVFIYQLEYTSNSYELTMRNLTRNWTNEEFENGGTQMKSIYRDTLTHQ